MNTFGNILRLTTFGESHGPAIGGVIDGIPAGAVISIGYVQQQLNLRRPGASTLTSQRREPDRVEFLSGLMALDSATSEMSALLPDSDTAIALGTPIGFIIRNVDARSDHYDQLRHIFRPSHADYAWHECYGGVRDWRGAGRSSGRETASRVVAGAVARQLLKQKGVEIVSEIAAIGTAKRPSPQETERIINELRNSADSIGGEVECRIKGLPAGVGEPVFGKLEQMLGSAMLSIGAVKGVEFGMGFAGCRRHGSEVSDSFELSADGKPICPDNFSGGTQGGISNGMPVVFRVAVKPTPTIGRKLRGITDRLQPIEFTPTGRHDPCIALRIGPVIEAMAALVVLDTMLMRRAESFYR